MVAIGHSRAHLSFDATLYQTEHVVPNTNDCRREATQWRA